MTDCSQLQTMLDAAIQTRSALNSPTYCEDKFDTITEQQLCRKRLPLAAIVGEFGHHALNNANSGSKQAWFVNSPTIAVATGTPTPTSYLNIHPFSRNCWLRIRRCSVISLSR